MLSDWKDVDAMSFYNHMVEHECSLHDVGVSAVEGKLIVRWSSLTLGNEVVGKQRVSPIGPDEYYTRSWVK